MVIAHNLTAMGTARQMGILDKRKAKSTEKLSSGYKINRSADDAAGLAISEKMRRQIRGLDQGADNIQDGISLVQTADGALDEVVGMLQRIRELSIKSYNGTNSESDIAAMQDEVDQLLIEIERVGETTTFNEERIFRGKKDVYVINRDKIGEEITETYSHVGLPEWLARNSDKRLEPHNTPEYAALTQDLTGAMLQIPDRYYGPLNHPDALAWGYTDHQGEWSPGLDNNPTAKLDFSGLFDVSDALELYGNLTALMGSGIVYPCGTCYDKSIGIGFEGTAGRVSAAFDKDLFHATYSNSEIGIVNLSGERFTAHDANGSETTYQGYFSAVESLIRAQERSGGTAAEKAAQAVSLGKEIAKSLRDVVLEKLDACAEKVDHFERVAANTDDYSLVVYDFREDWALTAEGKANSNAVTWGGFATYHVRHDVVEDNSFWMEVDKRIPIFAGVDAKQENKINIILPEISLKNLKLNGYRLGDQYTVEEYWEFSEIDLANADKKYQEDLEKYHKDLEKYNEYLEQEKSYQKKWDAWKEAWMMQDEHQHTVTTSTPSKHGFVNGEYTVTEWSTTTKTVSSYSWRILPGAPPKPEPPEPVKEPVEPVKDNGYKLKQRKVRREDVLDPVDEAIKYVSASRALLGAQQNRLEHAYRGNLNTSENTQASESVIRDTDMANELVAFSNSNILVQSVQSMLAQANQSNQGILNLLS